MADVRLCRFCNRVLLPRVVKPAEQAPEHCPSRSCHWCGECEAVKRQQGKHAAKD